MNACKCSSIPGPCRFFWEFPAELTRDGDLLKADICLVTLTALR